MYANLGPGHTIELDPPSPNGVDLLYSHEYVAQRMRERNLYGYVGNRSITHTDPGGKKEKKKHKKHKSKGQCACVWEKTDHKGCKYRDVEPAGLGQVSYFQCIQYCRGGAGTRKLVNIIWDGEWFNITN